MAILTLRLVKGTPLTNLEVDNNFSNLLSDINSIEANSGVLSQLTTFNKSNLVSAINEIASESTSNVTITGGTISGVSISSVSLTSNISLRGNISDSFGSNVTISNSTLTGITLLSSVFTGNVISSNVEISGGNITALTTPLPVSSGGTGATNGTQALLNLGLDVGAFADPIPFAIALG
jgi:hypothetical protein